MPAARPENESMAEVDGEGKSQRVNQDGIM